MLSRPKNNQIMEIIYTNYKEGDTYLTYGTECNQIKRIIYKKLFY